MENEGIIRIEAYGFSDRIMLALNLVWGFFTVLMFGELKISVEVMND